MIFYLILKMMKPDIINLIYYQLKPLIPRSLQILLRSKVAIRKRNFYKSIWPILEIAGISPKGWPGWPNDKQFSLVLTHDVETAIGQKKCGQLIELERLLGFRSSFNFVPERYNVSSELRQYLMDEGFEVGVHGLNHDGKLFRSQKIFQQRTHKINKYIKAWNAKGFRSPAMHHNLDWLHELNIAYDSSTFDTDPFQPRPEGAETIFPFLPNGISSRRGYVELPTTMPQDFVLFIMLKEENIDIWTSKLDWIAKKGGMALLNTHPDYMNFKSGKGSFEEYPAEYYVEFLNYIKKRYEGKYWHALPRQISSFYKHCLSSQ